MTWIFMFCSLIEEGLHRIDDGAEKDVLGLLLGRERVKVDEARVSLGGGVLDGSVGLPVPDLIGAPSVMLSAFFGVGVCEAELDARDGAVALPLFGFVPRLLGVVADRGAEDSVGFVAGLSDEFNGCFHMGDGKGFGGRSQELSSDFAHFIISIMWPSKHMYLEWAQERSFSILTSTPRLSLVLRTGSHSLKLGPCFW